MIHDSSEVQAFGDINKRTMFLSAGEAIDCQNSNPDKAIWYFSAPDLSYWVVSKWDLRSLGGELAKPPLN